MTLIKHLLLLSTLALITVGCKKNTPTPVAPVIPTQSTPQPNYYFNATIDGNQVALDDLSGTSGSGAGLSSTNSGQHEQSLYVGSVRGGTNGGVFIVQTFANSVTKCSEVESMFKVGTYSYANTFSGIDGAGVYFTDSNGVYWTTSVDSNSTQSGSFEILTHTANDDGYAKFTTTAKFNCTLYDNNGNSMILTNGEIKSRSVQCMDLD